MDCWCQWLISCSYFVHNLSPVNICQNVSAFRHKTPYILYVNDIFTALIVEKLSV